jgi:hypothetical protein
MSPYQRTNWPNGAAKIRESRESLSDAHVRRICLRGNPG